MLYRVWIGSVVVCGFLPITSSALAIVLNDQLAADVGGYSNYYDRDNVYSNVGLISMPVDGGGTCSGTLIAPRVMLTAAHCMMGDKGQLIASPQTTIEFSPDAVNPTDGFSFAAGVVVHSGFDYFSLSNDVALVAMRYGYWDGTPVQLTAPGAALPDIGTRLKFVGYGATGTGSNPPDRDIGPYDFKRRVGETNFYGYLSGNEFWSDDEQKFLIGIFANPLTSDETVSSLQAGTAPTDSGGPLFVETANGLVQIGIASWVENYTGASQFGYGATNAWTNVADYLDWIYENNPTRYVAALPGNFNWSDLSAWKDLEGRAVSMPQNIDGNFENHGFAGRYYNVLLASAGTITVDTDPTLDTLFISHPRATLDLPFDQYMLVWQDVEINAGRLVVDGTLDTSYVLLNGGALSGTGDILTYDGVYNLNGLIAPGGLNSVGTLAIDGQFGQWRDGTLAIRIEGDQSSRLAISGNAFLGGRLIVNGSNLRAGERRLVLSAVAVSGQFAELIEPFVFFDISAEYSANSVFIDINRNARTFVNAVTTANGKAIAQAIEGLGQDNPVYNAVLQLQETQGDAVFRSLSGDVYVSSPAILIDTSRYVRDAIGTRLRQAFADTETSVGPQAHMIENSDVTLWAQGFGTRGNYTAHGFDDLDTRTSGVFFGADAPIGLWQIGMAGGYSHTTIDGLTASSQGENYYAAIYGGTRAGPIRLNLGSAITWYRQDVTRSINFSGLADHTYSEHTTGSVQGFVDVGYGYAVGATTIEPYAGLAWVHLGGSNGTENGNAAALSYRTEPMDSFISTLGVRTETHFGLNGSAPVNLSTVLGWRRADGDLAADSSMLFEQGDAPFAITGLPISRNALVAEARIGMDIAGNAQLGLTYSGQFSETSRDQSLKADLLWRF
ncbi:autotransporter domain-containing protein [Ochrobactrum vermis]|uniref:Autotransporter domain-containing protein n=1 Tax=Ochrobactrum vermis TaxID=1827297 RepID=A0ABU8PMP0_9HYPH|nr:autotransporter domain-containing protein [Ochrobactrum vermis]PQZ26935.1 hypothetical protein CQZ93_24095 [Ochrobactrum vermis]